MTILQLLEECAKELGTVKPSIEEFDTVIVPVENVRQKLLSAFHQLSAQNDQRKQEEEEEI